MPPRAAMLPRASTLGLLWAIGGVLGGCASSHAGRTLGDAAVSLPPAAHAVRSDEPAPPTAARSAADGAFEELDLAALPTLAEARADLTELLLATKVRSAYQWDEERVATARSLGYDETRALRLLASFVERGEKASERLEAVDAKQPVDAMGLLFAYVARVGTPRSLPLVFALSKRGVGGSSAVETLLERAALPKRDASCAPPSKEELAKARSLLGGSAVIERVGTTLVAREPSAAELDDLAYFHAAIARDGGPVGHDPISGQRAGLQAPPPNAPLDAERQALVEAMKNGGPKIVQTSARRYLALLGYPGAIRAEEESNMTWGGPGYANVMRDLAHVDEVLGDVAEAADLYRRAPPGGGMCGTSVAYRLEEQRKGVIRAAERAGQCHTAVRERLYAVHEEGFDYGPTRLASAGWDVARLYRAALLASEREAPAHEITSALDRLPSPRREEALARFERLGPEAWARDLRAIGGLADVEGERALPQLLGLSRTGSEAVRAEVLRVLTDLGDRAPADPCVPDGSLWLAGATSYGGETPRKVKHLNHVCATKLSVAAQASIVDAFVAAARDPSDRVREASAEGIGHVAEPKRALPVLEALAKDAYARPGWSRTGKNKQRLPVLPVAEAAQTALVEVRAEEKRARERERERASAQARGEAR